MVGETVSHYRIIAEIGGGMGVVYTVGRTPLVDTRLPRGVFLWRFEVAGYEPIEVLRATGTVVRPGFERAVSLPAPRSRPSGMVAVSVPPGGMRLKLSEYTYGRSDPRVTSSSPEPTCASFNFAPRVHIPILIMNGDEDYIFPLQTSQRPLFEGLGTPSADKKHVLYPGGHEIFVTQRSQIVQEVVGWLDRYVGRVQ
jgi:pimeloyl-ACP methyl ester carboxylesterase